LSATISVLRPLRASFEAWCADFFAPDKPERLWRDVLSPFADMAEVGQVIYLTHHAHLCDIAAQVSPDAQIHRLGPKPAVSAGFVGQAGVIQAAD
jgi:hypothetical protein